MDSFEARKERMSAVIKEHALGINDSCTKSFYPDITEKEKIKATKEIDPYLNIFDVVAILDTSRTKSLKNGAVFTLSGMYYKEPFGKPFFVNYKDIQGVEVDKDKNGYYTLNASLRIITKSGLEFFIGSGGIEKNILYGTITELKIIAKEWDDIIGKPSGYVGELTLTDDEKKKCHAIIHAASAAAGGVGTGLAQLPMADTAAITPIQIAMITGLGAIFDLRVTEGAANGIIGSLTAGFIGRGISQFLVGWIPGIGNAINTATAAGLTEAVGWVAVKYFFDIKNSQRAGSRVEGFEAGYEAASSQYENKFKKLTDEFINQQKNVEDNIEEYKELVRKLMEYCKFLEQEIAELKTQKVKEIPESLSREYRTAKNDLEKLRKLYGGESWEKATS